MVDEAEMSLVLSEFASTLATDFSIETILDHLVARIVDVLPITGAGVTLLAPGEDPHYIAASDPVAMRYERLQNRLKQGPCRLAYDTSELVAIPDLAIDARFPEFAPAALNAGLAAVFTFPLRGNEGSLGALDLYRDTAGALDDHDLNSAQTLANVATAYLINATARNEAHSASARFRHIAMHDALTGLPNRLLLQQRIDLGDKHGWRARAHTAVLFVDLDRFKRVNDAYGHQVGDELLQAVADRLSGLIRPTDTLARVSGDEFVFLCEDVPDAKAVAVLARRIEAAFNRPFSLPGLEIEVSASVGSAYARPGEDVSAYLVNQADLAMYEAKRLDEAAPSAGPLHRADPSSLEADLRDACTEGTLHIAYQPIVRTTDGAITNVEALVRWTHPRRGPIPAASIVAMAEQSGIIHELGRWVLAQSCLDHALWAKGHPEIDIGLAVNVSAHQLTRPDFGELVETVIGQTSMSPGKLVLEMTENLLIEDSKRALAVLEDLRALGVRLALDDFGTGYSSLSYLHQLPIDILKIDQSFISNSRHTAKDSTIVSAVTNLAHALDLTVTAEGVETKAQHLAVLSLGCDEAQGYYYARPMPAEALREHFVALRPLPAPRSGIGH